MEEKKVKGINLSEKKKSGLKPQSKGSEKKIEYLKE